MMPYLKEIENKVCVIYEYGEESWSTPNSLMSGFSEIGWEVDRVHLTKSPEKVLEKPYDFVVVMDWKGIPLPKGLMENLKGNTFLVRENGDEPQNYQNHSKACEEYDLILTPDYPSYLKRQQEGINTLWWPHFADTNIHQEYLGFDKFPKVRSTRGPGNSPIMDYLSHIMPQTFVNKNGLIGEDYGLFLSNGEITFQNSRWKEITRRVFEGMACNTMILTDRLPKETNIDALFVEDVDIVYYDSIPECISKINYYLSPEGREKRLWISENGFKKTIKYHTQKERAIAIEQEWIKWRLNYEK